MGTDIFSIRLRVAPARGQVYSICGATGGNFSRSVAGMAAAIFGDREKFPNSAFQTDPGSVILGHGRDTDDAPTVGATLQFRHRPHTLRYHCTVKRFASARDAKE